MKKSENASSKQMSSTEDSTLSFFSLYRFAERWDWLLLFFGLLFTFIKGCNFPFMVLIFGEFTTLLVDRSYGKGTSTPTVILKWFGGGKILTNASIEENNAEMMNDSIAYFYAAIIEALVMLIAGIISVDCFNKAGISQITRIRIKYFTSLMRQNIGWYDIEKSKSNLTVRLSEDIEKIKFGIAEQVTHFLSLLISFLIFVISAFAYGWQLTLIVISYIPILLVLNLFISKVQVLTSTKELNAYGKAANIAEEVLSGIRTVLAFGGEKLEVEHYKKHLQSAEIVARNKSLFASIGDGTTRFLYFISCAISFWFGVQWVIEDRDKEDKEYTAVTLNVVITGLVLGADQFVRIPQFLDIFASALASAKIIFEVIDRQSEIDALESCGAIIDVNNLKGNIKFEDVSFEYPSRPNNQILNGLNLNIEAGQTIALVGNSGNGKSTCLHLLQRFYDPNHGNVLIDDYDIRSLNINSLRSCIATVCQEPVLFSATIADNIRYGNPSATNQDVIAAARDAGAHDFIARLPQDYNTFVGEGGSQFSGGQKQRIAIARALIQNPKILILDEPTSALDYHSEKLVQEALDKASVGRTTIVVSHRMSAIKNADRIIFIDKGQVVEDGTHNKLIASKGRYYDLIKSTYNELETSKREETSQDHSVEVEPSSFAFTADVAEKDLKHAEDPIEYWKIFKRILKLVKQDWVFATIAVISSIILGFSLPLFSVIFSDIYGILSMENPAEIREELITSCVLLVGIGIIMFGMAVAQTILLAKVGTELTQRIRLMAFDAMLHQECGWFDEEQNAVGVLASHLSGDAADIQNAVGFSLSMILQSISSVVFGIVVAFSASIKLSSICFCALVFMMVFILIEARNLSISEMSEKDSIGIGMKIASEAITNIKTVASLRQEKWIIERFTNEMENVREISRKKIALRGLLSSVTFSIPSVAYGVAFFYGGYMVTNREIEYKYVVRVCEALLYGLVIMSQALVFAPTITTAFIGAHRLFKIIDRSPLIESPNITNKSRKVDKCDDISFRRIDFRYPTRPDVRILKGFDLRIAEGKTIALVGPSGCGKSTCIQLLQRFYDPEQGRVRIGLDEITRDIAIKDLRSKLSIVSQEPTLFDRTIAENIAYGDNSRKVTMNEIIEAAIIANAHSFIIQLAQGYDTNVGSRATQLSGGQKQRIAIARALIRNPKILLMDEPTSALDLHSEKIVQRTLDSSRTGRTCIIIAHRLSTIQNADIICVLQNGKIVESGTHAELLALNGIYTQLYNAQK